MTLTAQDYHRNGPDDRGGGGTDRVEGSGGPATPTRLIENPLKSAVGLAQLLHDRTRDFNAGVRNQVIELLSLELREAERVVDDLLLNLEADTSPADRVEQIELREVVDVIAQDLATSRHIRVSVAGDAPVRADARIASHIVRNLLRCVSYSNGEDIRVKVGGGFNKVFVEITYEGNAPVDLAIGEDAPEIDVPETSPGHPYRLAMTAARTLARRIGGDVTASYRDSGGILELSLPKTLGPYRGKLKIADSIFDPDPDGPTRSEIAQVLESGGPDMVFQPIRDLRAGGDDTGHDVGHEALARFPSATPPEWLEAAGHAGRRLELELSAIRSAMRVFAESGRSGFVAVNVSDATLLSPDLPQALYGMDGGLVVVELSEVALIKSYEATAHAMDALRDRSVRLAIDNVGAGEIDLWSILRLQPEIIKLDMSLVRGAEETPTNRALIRGLAAIARDLGIMTIAEGIETPAERDLVLEAGVEFGQGYLLGTPHRLDPAPADTGDDTI